MKETLKKFLSPSAFRFVKRVGLGIWSIPFGYNLTKLAQIYKADKWGTHYYTPHYQAHFRKFKFKKIKLLEIGVGGYHYPDRGGNSLRMWKRYFPFGRIFSLDIYDKSHLEESRIKIFKGSQIDEAVLADMVAKIGNLDIIVDDGSHINAHVIKTFELLFPSLKLGGIYVVEDTQTAYWPDYGGDSENLNNPATITNFFKSFVDRINHKELLKAGYVPSYLDRHITSIQFYHNLIFVYKGLNDEPSSVNADDPGSVLVDKMYV